MICYVTSVGILVWMIVPGVKGDTCIFRLPEYRNISLTLNIAISYSRLQGAVIYGGWMGAVNVKVNCKCVMCGIDSIETKIVQDLRVLLLL